MKLNLRTMELSGSVEEFAELVEIVDLDLDSVMNINDLLVDDEEAVDGVLPRSFGDAAHNQWNNDGRDLDVRPVRLVTGPNVGKVALRWPSGASLHNDWSYANKVEFVNKVYDYYNVDKKDRLFYYM